MNTTLKMVADAVSKARGWCDYAAKTNQTLGPYDVHNLNGPTTNHYYDCRRSWETEIAVALAEQQFEVDLSQHEIVNSGPWRDTVRSIHAAVNTEQAAEDEFEEQCSD